MCVHSIALGGKWEGVEERGGARLSPGTYPDPPNALLLTHISLRKKSLSLDFVWLVTYGHHCAQIHSINPAATKQVSNQTKTFT